MRWNWFTGTFRRCRRWHRMAHLQQRSQLSLLQFTPPLLYASRTPASPALKHHGVATQLRPTMNLRSIVVLRKCGTLLKHAGGKPEKDCIASSRLRIWCARMRKEPAVKLLCTPVWWKCPGNACEVNVYPKSLCLRFGRLLV